MGWGKEICQLEVTPPASALLARPRVLGGPWHPGQEPFLLGGDNSIEGRNLEIVA